MGERAVVLEPEKLAAEELSLTRDELGAGGGALGVGHFEAEVAGGGGGDCDRVDAGGQVGGEVAFRGVNGAVVDPGGCAGGGGQGEMDLAGGGDVDLGSGEGRGFEG